MMQSRRSTRSMTKARGDKGIRVMAIRKRRKVSAAGVVAAILMCFVMYFVTRTPRAESPPQASVEPQADVTSVADPATEAVRRSPVAKEPPGGVSAVW